MYRACDTFFGGVRALVGELVIGGVVVPALGGGVLAAAMANEYCGGS